MDGTDQTYLAIVDLQGDRVKSMDGTTIQQMKQNVSTLMHDNYGYDSNVDPSANISDYPEDSS
jgi:hypothetical protein